MASKAQIRADRLAATSFEKWDSTSRGFFTGFFLSIRELLDHRELLRLLVRRQLKARYKDSSLGFLWTLIRPLTMLLIYYVAIGQFLGAARGIPDFAIFVFAGLTLWGLYSEIVSAGTTSIIENAGLIKKVYLPREIFPLAAAGSALFNFCVQMIVLIGATVVLGQFPLSWNLLYVPVAIIIVVIYGVALAVLLSALNVFLRDVQYLVEVSMLIFFWVSPIVYAWGYVTDAADRLELPWLENIYLLNPVTDAILAFQKGLWAAGSQYRTVGIDVATGKPNVIPPQVWPADLDLRLFVMILVGLVLLFIAQRVFSRLQGNFAQEI
jgi:ABC-2 type transport system permease protein